VSRGRGQRAEGRGQRAVDNHQINNTLTIDECTSICLKSHETARRIDFRLLFLIAGRV
jgi:hypothetical protein